MESVIRALVMYLFVLIAVRLAGSRTLSKMNLIDFVLVLIMSIVAAQAIIGYDYSLTNAIVIISTLIAINILFSFIKHKSRWFERVIDGSPLIVINNGKMVADNMDIAKVEEADILEAARKWQGIESLEQIKYAILEKDGEITVIPK